MTNQASQRGGRGREGVEYQRERASVKHTLDQSGTILREVLDDDIATPIPEEAIEGRLVLVLGDVVADLDDTAISSA